MPCRLRTLVLALALLLGAGIGTAHGGTLWWTNIVSANHSIGRADISGSGADRSFISGLGDPYGMFVSADRIYWANFAQGTIARARLDGSDRDDAFISGASAPADIFADDRYIYWSNSRSNSIGRARLDGSGVNQSFITGTRSSATVWADESHLYWGNGSFSGASSIGRANIDGTGVDQDWLTGPGIRSPATVVTNDAFVYWTNSTGAPTIGRARRDGTDVNGSFVTAGPTGSLPNGLAISGQYLYWSLFSANSLGRAALDGSSVNTGFLAAPSSRTQGPGSVSVSQYPLTARPSGPGRITSSPRGIDCGDDCAEQYPEATTVVLSATPDDDARFTGWGGACAGTGACAVFTSAPAVVAASFAPLPAGSPVLTVSVSGPGTVTSSPSGIACGADCRQAFAAGTAVSLTPTPADGAMFLGWQGACSGTGACTVTMRESRAVSAVFAPVAASSPVLSVATAGTGHGRVTSSPAGISCGFDCIQAFPLGSAVTLTAAPSPGSVFSRWGGACSGSASSCVVPMTASQAVRATFVPDNRFRISRVRVTPATFAESVRVPGPGRVVMTARAWSTKGLVGTACSVQRSPRRAATLRLACVLGPAATTAGRAGPVRLSVRTTYTPVGGASRSARAWRVVPRAS